MYESKYNNSESLVEMSTFPVFVMVTKFNLQQQS